MVAISRDDRQAACVSPKRPKSSFAKIPGAVLAFDCMQAPPGLHSLCRDSVEPQPIPELQCGLIGRAVEGISRHVIFAP